MHERIAELTRALHNDGWQIVTIVPYLASAFRITAKRWCEKHRDMLVCEYALSGVIITDARMFQAVIDKVTSGFAARWNERGCA